MQSTVHLRVILIYFLLGAILNTRLPPYTCIQFNIPRAEVVLEDGSDVHAQGFISDSPNPQRYARDALPEDPTIRFSFRIMGTYKFGRDFCRYPFAHGEVTVKDVNKLVDRISGVQVPDMAQKSRRFISPDSFLGRPRSTYI